MSSDPEVRRLELGDEMLAVVSNLDKLATKFAVAVRCKNYTAMHNIGVRMSILSGRVTEITLEVLK